MFIPHHHSHRLWTSHACSTHIYSKKKKKNAGAFTTPTSHCHPPLTWYPPVRPLLYPVLAAYTEPSMARTVLTSQNHCKLTATVASQLPGYSHRLHPIPAEG